MSSKGNENPCPLGKLICFETPTQSETPSLISIAVFEKLKQSNHRFPNVEMMILPLQSVPSAAKIKEINNLDEETMGAMGEYYDLEKEAYYSFNRDQAAQVILTKMKAGTTVVLVGGYYIAGILHTEGLKEAYSHEDFDFFPDVHTVDGIGREYGLPRPDVTFLVDALNLKIPETEKGYVTCTMKKKYSSLVKNDLPSDIVPLDANHSLEELVNKCTDIIWRRCRQDRYIPRFITGNVLRRIFGIWPAPTRPKRNNGEEKTITSGGRRLPLYHGGIRIHRLLSEFPSMPTNRRLGLYLKKAKTLKDATNEAIKTFVTRMEELTAVGTGFEEVGRVLKSEVFMLGMSSLQKSVDCCEEVVTLLQDEFV